MYGLDWFRGKNREGSKMWIMYYIRHVYVVKMSLRSLVKMDV